MKKLLVFLKKYTKETILAPLFKMLEASFELLIPLVVKQIVDVGIATGDRNYVIKMCLVMVALGLIGLVCAVTAQYFSAKAAVGFATSLRHTLFAHMQKLSYSQMDGVGTSTMVTRMTSDVNQVQNGVNMVLRLFLRSPFIVFGAMIMAFTIDVKSALIFAVVIPLLSIVVFGVMKLTIPLFKQVQRGLDRVTGTTRGNLTGVRVIRAFHMEDEEVEDFGQRNQELTDLQMKVGKISAITNPFTYVIVNVGLVVLLWTGAAQVQVGILTQGAVMALVNYISQILVELIKLANLIVLINKALACANRIQAILDMEPDMKQGGDEDGAVAAHADEAAGQIAGKQGGESPYILEFDHVSMTYPGAGDESLTDVNLKVKKGETIGVIGGTGSGKSTFVNLIPRFYEITKGSLLVDGTPIEELPLKALRDRIGVVPQKAVLFKGTIRDNLTMGKADATLEEIESALEIAQAKEIVEGKPEGLDTMISQGGKNLSGGQRQRFTIARALVRKPEILILDDSASALDYATDARLRASLKTLDYNPTVFIVSQRASSLMHADQIVVLDDGEVMGVGTHEQLLENCEVYQEIYYSQYPDARPVQTQDAQVEYLAGKSPACEDGKGAKA
ncbi:MAG: ABC transporter ATP-binding protein [Lachnospiraceae bacterium]|nr:ABC transporter ATP-binding protein [Lachnospiraceae bacterium]